MRMSMFQFCSTLFKLRITTVHTVRKWEGTKIIISSCIFHVPFSVPDGRPLRWGPLWLKSSTLHLCTHSTKCPLGCYAIRSWIHIAGNAQVAFMQRHSWCPLMSLVQESKWLYLKADSDVRPSTLNNTIKQSSRTLPKRGASRESCSIADHMWSLGYSYLAMPIHAALISERSQSLVDFARYECDRMTFVVSSPRENRCNMAAQRDANDRTGA